MQIRMCVFGDEVTEKVIVRFARNQDGPLIEVEYGNRWWGCGVDVRCAPGKQIRPFVTCVPHMCSYVSEVGGALSGAKGLSYFLKYVCVRM